MRPWSLLTILNFFEGGPTDKRYFNVSSPSSRRDNENLYKWLTLDNTKDFDYIPHDLLILQILIFTA